MTGGGNRGLYIARSATDKSTTLEEELTSECLEVILWLRCHNSTSKCPNGERHGRVWFRTQRLLDSSRVWLGINDGERRQDIESVAADRRRLWLGEERVRMREWVITSQH